MYETLVPGSYEDENTIIRLNCGHSSVLSHLSSTSGTRKAEKVGVLSIDAKPDHPVLNQDTTQPFPEGQLPRSCILGMTLAQIRSANVRERGGRITPSSHSQSNIHCRYQLVEPPHGAGFIAMPFRHTIHTCGRGHCGVGLQPQFHGVAAARGWSRRGILKA